MHTFYIDVPYDYKYNWSISSNSEIVLKETTGALSVKFICNNGGLISEGDCYLVRLTDEQEVLVFLLKTGFKLVDSKKAELYIERHTNATKNAMNERDREQIANGTHPGAFDRYIGNIPVYNI